MASKNPTGVQPEIRDIILNGEELIDMLTLPMPAEADLDGAATLADVIAKQNAILAKMRTAGLLGV